MLDRVLPEHNRKFSKPAATSEPTWRKTTSTEIEQALCFKQQRTVAKDNTVTFEGTVFSDPEEISLSLLRQQENRRACPFGRGSGVFLPKTTNRTVRFQNDARIGLISKERQAGGVPLWTHYEVSKPIP